LQIHLNEQMNINEKKTRLAKNKDKCKQQQQQNRIEMRLPS